MIFGILIFYINGSDNAAMCFGVLQLLFNKVIYRYMHGQSCYLLHCLLMLAEKIKFASHDCLKNDRHIFLLVARADEP